MARGWESKAVADWIEEGNSPKDRPRTGPASPAERAVKERLELAATFEVRGCCSSWSELLILRTGAFC